MASLSQSLSNMSVGADNTPDTAGLLMPKLQYRFRVIFSNFGVAAATQELTKQVIDVTRPQVTFTEIPIDVYNSKLYLAGKHDWSALTINIRDDATNAVASLVGQQLQKQLDFAEQASAATGSDYKFEMQIQILDGGNGTLTPNELETWQLAGCFIQAANYNNLNYGTSEVVTVSLTIRFDNALQSKTPITDFAQNGTLGQTVGRALGTTTVTSLGQ